MKIPLSTMMSAARRTSSRLSTAKPLRRVWQVQQFSAEMTALLHHEHTDPYAARLQRAQLQRLCTSRAAMASFCEEYVGLPFAGSAAVGRGAVL